MKFTPPSACPSCSSELVWQKDQLYCRNTSCPAKLSKSVEHFAKTMKIKGLGPATIKKLDLTSISEIYINDLSEIESEKIREKLKAELENSKKASLNQILPALGIPLVGKTASDKLANVCSSILDINEETCKKAGLGEKTTNNILDWMASNLDWWLELPFSFLFEKAKLEQKGVVCISGKLNSFKTKQEATKILEELGWKVVSNLTKEVTHLVNESGKSTAKTEKAEATGIVIIENLKDIIGE